MDSYYLSPFILRIANNMLHVKWLFVCLLIHLFTKLFVYSFICLLSYLFTKLFVYSFICLLIHLFTKLFVYSFICSLSNIYFFLSNDPMWYRDIRLPG